MGQARRLRGVVAVVLAALVVACWAAAGFLLVQRRAVRGVVDRMAGEVQARVRAALDEQLQHAGAEAERAAGLRPLQAAVRHRVDLATFRDLLASEEWWRPLRGWRALIAGADGWQVDSGPEAQGLLEPPLIAEARARRSARGWIGSGELLAAAAVALPPSPERRSARPDRESEPPAPVLVLGQTLDRARLQPVAGRLGVNLLGSDGRAGSPYAGHDGRRERLGELIGREAAGLQVDPLGRWLAVPVALAPGRWIWAQRDLSGPPVVGKQVPAVLLGLGALAGLGLLPILRRPRAPRPRPEEPTAVLEAPPQTFGRYTLLERIGQGGMSDLYTAVLTGAEGFQRIFAIKRLKPHLAESKPVVDQFIDEAKLGSLLVHSNIVPTFDFGKVAGGYFLAQEYIVGRNLVQIVNRHVERQGRALPVPLVLYIAREVLEALAYAHSRVGDDGQPLQIVHRDVAGANVMVTAQGEVKLLDFGIVRASERLASTEHGAIKGNASFMSPEQARGLPVDCRSDLFSLGMTMYYVLTGEPLYGQRNPAAAFYEATMGPNAAHRERVRALPPPLPSILERALAADPAARYPTAHDFAAALDPGSTGPKAELAALIHTLFGEELRRQAARYRARLASSPPTPQDS